MKPGVLDFARPPFGCLMGPKDPRLGPVHSISMPYEVFQGTRQITFYNRFLVFIPLVACRPADGSKVMYYAFHGTPALSRPSNPNAPPHGVIRRPPRRYISPGGPSSTDHRRRSHLASSLSASPFASLTSAAQISIYHPAKTFHASRPRLPSNVTSVVDRHSPSRLSPSSLAVADASQLAYYTLGPPRHRHSP